MDRNSKGNGRKRSKRDEEGRTRREIGEKCTSEMENRKRSGRNKGSRKRGENKRELQE